MAAMVDKDQYINTKFTRTQVLEANLSHTPNLRGGSLPSLPAGGEQCGSYLECERKNIYQYLFLIQHLLN